MLRVLILLCFLLPFAATSQTSLTAITYNIRFDNPADSADAWPLRRAQLAAQLRFYAPDVFGIQEGLHRQVEYLSEQLPAFQRVGGGRDDGKEAGEYSALYFLKARFGLLQSGTFWLSETPDVPSKGWDANLPRVCTYAHLYDTLASKKIWVFNTHFDHIGKEARRRSAELILLKIKELNKENEPVILMGDFNSEPGEKPVVLLSRALLDTRAISREPSFGPEGTFNAFQFHEPVKRLIDYIFINGSGMRVRQHAVLSDSKNCHYPSDHLPVLARMEY
jgi:endonuclease/exonuclease/phosphatase family metal-dependent hydrolase